MPQTGPDLVSAGYPISRPLTALLGGTMNSAQGDIPVASNLDFGYNNLQSIDYASAAGAGGSVYTVPVPVSPGTTVTTMSLLGGTASGVGAASVKSLWAALYTGSGSAFGTTNAQPTLIASGVPGSVATGAASLYAITASQRLDFTFTSPQTITSVQAPYGYIYASWSLTTLSGSNQWSLISASCASIALYRWYSTSPVGSWVSNGGAGSTAPTNLGTGTYLTNPPVIMLR